MQPTDELAARRLAEKTARGPADVAALRDAEEERREANPPPKAWRVFVESFAAEITRDEARRRAWSEALIKAVHEEMGDVQKLARRDDERAHLAREAEDWKKEADPFEVWDRKWDRDVVSHTTSMFGLLGHLLRIDPGAWVDAVDSLPSPRWMRLECLFSSLPEDYDLVLDLLTRAPPVFDVKGQRASVVALLLLEQAEKHAQELYEAVDFPARTTSDEALRAETKEKLATLRRGELPEKLRQTYRVLLARPDGHAIAPALLARLGRNVLLSADPGDGFSVHRCALDALAVVLAQAGIGVTELQAAWEAWERRDEQQAKAAAREPRRLARGRTGKKPERWGEGRRTLHADGLPILVGAADILTELPPAAELAAELWRWFERLLVGRDPGLGLVEHGSSSSLVPNLLGAMLARVPHPAEAWRSTYKKLEPQRRRLLYGRRYDDLDVDLGSRLLITVALAGCGHAMRSATDPAGQHAIHGWFWAVFDAAQRLRLTCRFDLNDARRNLVARCFAFMPALFGDHHLDEALRRAVPLIATDPPLLALASWLLWKNGVAPERLEPLLVRAGVNLRAALRDANEERDAPVELQELAQALGVALDTPSEPTPTPAVKATSELRAAFVRGIRWGRDLLDRLDRDGCTLVHAAPLDRRSTSFLLQVRLPAPLAGTFGLAPEARILAAHGWFDARDLGRVLDEPLRADAVDPDLIIVANDRPDLARRLPLLPGPWGQRVPWTAERPPVAPLAETLRDYLPMFDLFDRRDPVHGRQLFGRQSLIQKLASRLSRGEAVGVFGLRKVGKSSLLRAVVEALDPIAARRGFFEDNAVLLPQAEPHALIVSLDVQGVSERSLAGVVGRLAEGLEERLKLAGLWSLSPDEPGIVEPLPKLERLLRVALQRSALPVCVVLDEYDLLFEGYAGEPGVHGIERLFQLLRGLAQGTRRVSVAVIGRDPVFFERPHMGERTNPMLGWAETVWLGPLARDEADELLTRLGLRVGLAVGSETKEDAWSLTGGHPLLLRQYGSALHERAAAREHHDYPRPTDPLLDEARRAFLERGVVRSLVTEVLSILASRFPAALSLLRELTSPAVEVDDLSKIFARNDGWDGDAALTLRHFGIMQGDDAKSFFIADVFWRHLQRNRGNGYGH